MLDEPTTREVRSEFLPKRPFAGGDLLLHDAGRAGGGPAGAFSRIDPLCDSIVFFPSDCLHEVTPVACGAGFGDGRFTVNGWIRGRSAAYRRLIGR